MYFTIPKRPIYVNYEVLTNCFNCKAVDMSEAQILEINPSEMSKKQF